MFKGMKESKDVLMGGAFAPTRVALATNASCCPFMMCTVCENNLTVLWAQTTLCRPNACPGLTLYDMSDQFHVHRVSH